MRDRLIELLNFVRCKVECCAALDGGRCGDLDKLDRCQIEAIADHLLANGVIVPPCKVGDTVWFELYGQIESAVIYHCTYELQCKGCLLSGAYAKDTRGIELRFNANSIGKGVFLTREEAEQALKGAQHEE